MGLDSLVKFSYLVGALLFMYFGWDLFKTQQPPGFLRKLVFSMLIPPSTALWVFYCFPGTIGTKKTRKTLTPQEIRGSLLYLFLTTVFVLGTLLELRQQATISSEIPFFYLSLLFSGALLNECKFDNVKFAGFLTGVLFGLVIYVLLE